MSRCRWDREREEYLRDGEPCKRDDYGDPTKHCTARRSCANHIGHAELTCARCVGRTRNDVRRIVSIAPLMGVQALGTGVDSEAAMLAGPACDQEAWSRRKITARQGGPWHASLPFELGGDKKHVEDDDEHHAYSVLTRWEFMLREDYDQPRADATSITEAGAYLERVLHRMAQDDGQDFPLFAREMRQCREHLESVLRNSGKPERGAPCPSCQTPAPRLALEHGHWCDDPECTRIHYPQDADRWVCPRDRSHTWEEDDYRKWVADVYEAQRSVGA